MKMTTCIVILAGLFFLGWLINTADKEDQQWRNKPVVTQTVTPLCEDSDPVYKLVGRMEIMHTRPAAVSYVFERGGSSEYVEASKVHDGEPGEGFKKTEFFVKFKTGEFWNLGTAASAPH